MVLVEVTQLVEHEHWSIHGRELDLKVARLVESLNIYIYKDNTAAMLLQRR